MSNKAYYTECTEYESGWGCRPDGYMITLDRDVLKAQCAITNATRGHEVTRTGDIHLCMITDEGKAEIEASKGQLIWTWSNKKEYILEG